MRLVELQNNTRPPVPELGRIRLGAPKIDPKKPGTPLPHFRVDFNDTYKHLEEVWNALYPAAPVVLDNVFAAYPEADKAFESAYEDWGAARVLKRRCDGQTIHQSYNPTTQRYEFIKKPCQCAALPKRVCRKVGRFAFVVRDFFEFAARRHIHALGYFIVTTSSSHNIQRIDALLHGVQAQYGSLQGIPFRLERTAEEVSTPIPEDKEKGRQATRIMKKHYFIDIRTADEFAPHAAAAMLTTGAQTAALPAPAAPMLAAPDENGVIDSDFETPERRECFLTSAYVSHDNRGPYIRFGTDQGFDAYRRSTDIFSEAGWSSDSDWTEQGQYDLPIPIPAIIEHFGGEFWQVVHVFPAGR